MAEERGFRGVKVTQKVLGIFGRDKADGLALMRRVRIHEGFFIPTQGLVGHDFWHIYDEDLKEEMGDRAVLLQSIQNYRIVALAGFNKFPVNDEEALADPRFGEQILVDCDHDICLGDVYEVTNSTLKLRVTAPRKTTQDLDLKNKTPTGSKGIHHMVHSTGMAGWFCEVLCEGTMREGSDLVLVQRDHPKWTLQELCQAVYGGEGDPKLFLRHKPSWGRPMEELEELLAIPYLGELGWKQKLRIIKRQRGERIQPIPYLSAVSESSGAIATVLGLYGREDDLDEYMPRKQIREANFLPVQGLQGHDFWHQYDDWGRALKMNERAVLLQSIQNYRCIMQANFEAFPNEDVYVLIDPCFGEQIILDIPGDICLGDVYDFRGSSLRLRVTSPRKPCGEVDSKNETVFGVKGIRHFTCHRALAGWFCEVLRAGTIVKGSVMELVERPHPQWTMPELSKAVYGGEGDPKALLRASGSWGRSMEELYELLDTPCLAECEWKDELRKVLKKLVKKGHVSRTSVLFRRSRLGVFGQKNPWIPIILAFIIATMSCLMVVVTSTKHVEA
jgi:MOSC domain-containing protein YiiM